MKLETCIREFKSELPAFREMTEKFYRQEITTKEYKGFSGRYGSYAQRGGEASMLRLRMTGGRINKDKLRFIAETIEKHHVNKVHFTTCQTVQLHNLGPESVCQIMEEAVDCGIITWGGGGDFPRNVMTSPLSGVEQGEYFDVMPYVMASADYLMTLINRVKMPRKLKVGFSNSPANRAHATFRDLGFVAKEDGTFDVYSAGGLGLNPKLGICVDTGVQPEKILYYIKAMVEMFVEYGNYENRAKARTRYMQDTLGQEGYVEAYREKLGEVFASGEDLNVRVNVKDIEKTGDGSTADGPRVIPQKQEGLYAVAYHPIGGTPAPEIFRRLYDTIRHMKGVELRLAPDEAVYIINCTGAEAQQVLEVTADSARNLFETSVACIGATICQVGSRDSQGLIHTLVEELRNYDFPDGVLPQIHISGCPSSCGTHQIGSIGFHGGVKVIDKVPNPSFTLHINGCDQEGEERFGEKLGVILEKDIPAFLTDVAQAVLAAGTTYDNWYAGHQEELNAIAKRYLQ